MCGYTGYREDLPGQIGLLRTLGVRSEYPKGQFYPMRTHPGLLSLGSSGVEVSPATWWFLMREQGGQWKPNRDFTTFNARELSQPLWKKARQSGRGFVLATEFGETRDKTHYLMRARHGLILAALWQDWGNPRTTGVRSMAIITRPAHERLERYHPKASPCFLPDDAGFLRHWLDPEVPYEDPKIQSVLNEPKLYNDLDIQAVKTFKRAEPLGEPETVKAD